MKIKHILSISILTLLAGVAYAGLSNSVPVQIDFDNRTALGDQVTAKVSDNDFEYIGCGVTVFDDGAGGSFSFGFCQAGDSEGNEFVCFSQNANLLDSIRAGSAYAFISFSWNEAEECTRIRFSTQSVYLPIKKGK